MAATGSDVPNGECLTIIGVGLIGGSIGLAARRSGRFSRIVGVGRDRAALEGAVSRGCIDVAMSDLAAAARQADVLVCCTPVDVIAEFLLAAAPHCRPGALLTDAGSTKAAIVAAVEPQLPRHASFVAAHPLAGSEKRGPEHARADLFDDRLTVLTPSALTAVPAIARARHFWSSLGSRVTEMTPADHDRALAATSHLPHLLASALAWDLEPDWSELVASGFRDMTRLAAGDPRLWTAIFLHNQHHLIEALGRFEAALDPWRTALRAGDPGMIHQLLTDAKKVRDDLGS